MGAKIDFEDRYCYLCGKKFTVLGSCEDYAYKTYIPKIKNNKFFCSWKCFRAYRKDNPTRFQIAFAAEMKREAKAKEKEKQHAKA